MIRPQIDTLLEVVVKSQKSHMLTTGKENPILKDFETVLNYALALEIEIRGLKAMKK